MFHHSNLVEFKSLGIEQCHHEYWSIFYGDIFQVTCTLQVAQSTRNKSTTKLNSISLQLSYKSYLYVIDVPVIKHDPKADNSKKIENSRGILHHLIIEEGRKQIQHLSKNVLTSLRKCVISKETGKCIYNYSISSLNTMKCWMNFFNQ